MCVCARAKAYALLHVSPRPVLTFFHLDPSVGPLEPEENSTLADSFLFWPPPLQATRHTCKHNEHLDMHAHAET